MFRKLKDLFKRNEVYGNVLQRLKNIYKEKLLPLESQYLFHDFHSPQLADIDFDSKPMILFVGQYSTGKTTFIKYLLDRDFPGMRIGPEPTTDKFFAIMHDKKERIIPGNVLVVDPTKQYRPLSKYGNKFLNKFQCSTIDSPVLKHMTFIDTPGILSGEKQRLDRGYDFTGVLEWFAEHVDRIVLLFDAYKLDISDEFKRSIEALKGHDDKICIVLNKADLVDHRELVKINGALMWSLGKVLQTPEVSQVYIGSFWNKPLKYDVNNLFKEETNDLFKDLHSVPLNSTLRKLNIVIKRARLAKVHAYIISELKSGMPIFIKKEAKKMQMINNLQNIYNKLQKEHNMLPGDFPDINKMTSILINTDFSKFSTLKKHLINVVDDMLQNELPKLFVELSEEDFKKNLSDEEIKEEETSK